MPYLSVFQTEQDLVGQLRHVLALSDIRSAAQAPFLVAWVLAFGFSGGAKKRSEVGVEDRPFAHGATSIMRLVVCQSEQPTSKSG